jgi:hypothetical protein
MLSLLIIYQKIVQVPLVYLLTNELGGGTLASFFAATLLLLGNVINKTVTRKSLKFNA